MENMEEEDDSRLISMEDPLGAPDSIDSLREPLLMAGDEEDALATSPSVISKKGEYDLVSTSVSDHDADDNGEEPPIVQPEPQWQRILHACLLPDDRFTLYGMKVLDGPFVVKLLKFTAITFLGISFMHWLVRLMKWEHRESFTLSDFWVYESNLVVTDILFFFVVGRLSKQRGVDHVMWIFTAFLANIYPSYITDFSFLRHSFTLYEMHCKWPWQLWVFVAVVTVLVVGDAILHVRKAVRERVFLLKVMELLLCLLLLMVPSMTSPYFHLHHWYIGWFIGMHANFDVWWSRATMAWCWGLYMNGIAVYGRDPVLTCGYSYFLSLQQRCPYLECYLEGINAPKNETHPPVHEMIPPDWRNCSADTYHGR